MTDVLSQLVSKVASLETQLANMTARVLVAAGPPTTVSASTTVTNVSPNSGPATGGTAVTITGTGFIGATAVYFGGTGANFTPSTDDVTIAAISPSGNGVVDVTVVALGETSAVSSADQFTYAYPGGASTGPVTTATNVQIGAFAGWAPAPVTVTLTANDTNGVIAATYYTVDASGPQLYTGPFSISAPGSHLVTWWSIDTNGNAEPPNQGWVNICSTSTTPTGLTATAAGTGMILLDWTPVEPTVTQPLPPSGYNVYANTFTPPTTKILTTQANVVAVPQASTSPAMYYGVTSIVSDGVTESGMDVIGAAVVSYLITTTDITQNAITTPLLAANSVTARQIAANTITAAQIQANTITGSQIAASVSLTSPSISGATITGTTSITGAVIQTSAAGSGQARVVLNDPSYLGQVVLYDSSGNLCGELHGMTDIMVLTAAGGGGGTIDLQANAINVTGSLGVSGLLTCFGGIGPGLGISGAVTMNSTLSVSGASTLSGGLSVTGNVSATGFITASGTINCNTNYSGYGGADGVLIQDTSATSSRWRIAFNSSTHDLDVMNTSGTVYHVTLTTGA